MLKARQHNLTLAGCPYLELPGKHSKGAPWAMTKVLEHFMCLKMKGTLKTTHTQKLASKLNLHMNHKVHFPTLICDLLTRDIVSSQMGWLWSSGENDEHRLKMQPVKEEAAGKRLKTNKQKKHLFCFCTSPLVNVSPRGLKEITITHS